mmetsp:Transcript_47627/g.58550  ORF Transcript_47627/g.58550 Transcript_47627/m.58550 type:complete len:89 (-) Transcript_47627:20-286(-)
MNTFGAFLDFDISSRMQTNIIIFMCIAVIIVQIGSLYLKYQIRKLKELQKLIMEELEYLLENGIKKTNDKRTIVVGMKSKQHSSKRIY